MTRKITGWRESWKRGVATFWRGEASNVFRMRRQMRSLVDLYIADNRKDSSARYTLVKPEN